MDGELQNVQYWNPIAGIWQSTVPTFAIDHWNGLACRGVNLTSSNLPLYMYFYAYDPTGDLRDFWATDVIIVTPGAGFFANFGIWCDIPGDYKTECVLGTYGRFLDSVSPIVCHATAAPQITARIDTWWILNEPRVDFNSDIGIRVRGWNNSSIQLDIRADAKSYSPSGKTKTRTGGVLRVNPGEWSNVLWDFIWKGDEGGDWKADVILYAGLPGGALKEVDRRNNISIATVSYDIPPDLLSITEFKITNYVKV